MYPTSRRGLFRLEVRREPFGHRDVALPFLQGMPLLTDVTMQPRQRTLHGVNPALFWHLALLLVAMLAPGSF